MDICLSRNLFRCGQVKVLLCWIWTCISIMTYFTSFDIIFDLIRWHTRLGYIRQDRLARLARDGLSGSLTKELCEEKRISMQLTILYTL